MRFAIIALVSILFTNIVNAETISGRVVGVSDGDTITVLDSNNRQVKIRLAQIDAPEKTQDYGQVSKQALSDAVFGKDVSVEVETIDKYGRTVGKVLVSGVDVNLGQVSSGMAWVYRQYAKERAYFDAEDSAKAAKVGLWSQPNPTPPWEYRHGGKRAQVSKSAPTQLSGFETGTGSNSGSCGSKQYCKQMSDCAEAQHYLKDCGLSKLDKDGDGVPCESLCKR